MIQQLAHVCFRTDRIAEMLEFYREKLGLPVKFTMKNADGRDFGFYFELGHRSFLELFDQAGAVRQWGGSAEPLRQQKPTPYQHFCVEVAGIDAMRAALKSRGVDVTDVRVGMDGSKQAWIADPDGNRIELMEYTPQSRQLAPAG